MPASRLRDLLSEEMAAIDPEAANVGHTFGGPTDHQRRKFAAALAAGTGRIQTSNTRQIGRFQPDAGSDGNGNYGTNGRG